MFYPVNVPDLVRRTVNGAFANDPTIPCSPRITCAPLPPLGRPTGTASSVEPGRPNDSPC